MLTPFKQNVKALGTCFYTFVIKKSLNLSVYAQLQPNTVDLRLKAYQYIDVSFRKKYSYLLDQNVVTTSNTLKRSIAIKQGHEIGGWGGETQSSIPI